MKPEIILYVSMFGYLAAMLAQRYLGEKNIKLLSMERKEVLADIFSKYRWATIYIPLIIMLAVFGAQLLVAGSFRYAFPIGITAVLITSTVIQILIYLKVAKYDFPETFVRNYRTQLILVQLFNAIAMVGITVAVLQMRW